MYEQTNTSLLQLILILDSDIPLCLQSTKQIMSITIKHNFISNLLLLLHVSTHKGQHRVKQL